MPLLRRLEHAGRDASCASPPRARPRVPSRRAGAGAGRRPLADRRRGRPRLPVGHRRARPGPRRRAGRRVGRPARRRAGDRQVDARPPGRCRRSPRRRARRVLYASGEESAGQVRLRAARLGLLDGPAGDAIDVLAETDVERDHRAAPEPTGPALLVVDSDADRRPSTSSTGRPAASARSARSTLRLMDLAKGEGIAGRARRPRDEGRHRSPGPKTLEHLVDAVLDARRRAVRGAPRSCARRRTASGRPRRSASSRWASAGLREVADPARAFLAEHDTAGAPGSVVAPTLEGSRPLLVEVQALVAPAGYGTPTPHGERSRPEPAGAARRRARAAGGHRPGRPRRVREPRRRPDASTSPASTCPWRWPSPRRCATGRSSPATVAIGEVGLLGELRPVGRPGAAAARGGPARVPAGDRAAALATRRRPSGPSAWRSSAVATLREALEVALGR